MIEDGGCARNLGGETVLGIEGGGTRSRVILVNGADEVLYSQTAGPANFRLLTSGGLQDWLAGIHDALPANPHRVGIGLAGVRTVQDHRALAETVRHVWPGTQCATSDDLLIALEAAEWLPDCQAQVLTVSGTGSCSVGRHRNGDGVKVGGRGHILGDRAGSCDIAQRTLRAVVREFDANGDWPRLGAEILAFLQLNDPEDLIDWSIEATKTELASVAQVTFKAAQVQGDALAGQILDEAAARLSADSLQCADRISSREERVQFLFNGSVFLKNPAFAAGVRARLLAVRPGSVVASLTRAGVHGAVALARALPAAASGQTVAASGFFSGSRRERTPASVHAAAQAIGWKPVAESPTERRHPRSMKLSELPIPAAIILMLEEDATLPGKIREQAAAISWTVQRVVRAFAEGGRLIYAGAGTSGRIGVLDASECPPTFRTSCDLVQGIIAGGRSALWSAVEGAEDDATAGQRAIIFRNVSSHDVVMGISASGHAPFIWGCLAEAKQRGAATVLLCCNPGFRDHPLPDCSIVPDTGPEILTGSTRLKAGTATKLILNMISTLAMTHSGKVLSNLMIDLNPTNSKLRDRAVRIVVEITGAEAAAARRALVDGGWSVRTACSVLKGQSP